MPSTAGNVTRTIARDALRLNWRGLDAGFALRCSVGVAIPLVASTLAGQPLAGVSAAYGALVGGLASRQGVHRTRVGAMLGAGAALALSGFAGALTGPFPAANVALLALWALGFGLLAAIGRAATVISVNACVAYVLFSNPPYDAANPGFQALMVFAGAVLQMLLVVLVWPLRGFAAEQAAIAAAYAALSHYATGVRADDLGLPETQSVSAVSDALADPQPFGSREEIAAYQSLADEAERLRATLAALATEQHLLDEVGLTSAGAAVRAVCRAAGRWLDHIAAAVAADRVPAARDDDWRELDDACRALERTSPEGAAFVDDARALAGQLRAAVRSAAAAATGGIAIDPDAPRGQQVDFAPLGAVVDRLLANATWSSIYARHAIRMAVALTVAVVVQHLVPLAHAQWIVLTVAIVLRPDFASTFTRGFARVAGTVAGAILASLIAALHPHEAIYIVLAIGCAALAFALFNVSYALFSTMITGYVVFLLALGGAPEHASAFDRVVATAIGGALALLAYAAWPAWTHAHVADDLAALIDAQREHAGLVLRAFVEPVLDAPALRAAQVRAWRARAGAETAVEQMAAEPVRPRTISLRRAVGVLAASERFGIAILTLRARVARVGGAPHAIVERFSGDLDAALRAIASALRSGEAPARLPPLRNDQVALKHILDERRDPVVEVLVSQTDLIVDSTNTMAAILARSR